MENQSMKLSTSHSRLIDAKERRKRVIQRLERQLRLGNKMSKEGEVLLSPTDKVRIEKEIETLKTRI